MESPPDFMILPETFFEKVYMVVRLIPYGRVSTYGALGGFLSAKSSARMVGYAMNHAHQIEEFVPAHRVVNRIGILTGKHHFGSPSLMQQLLENEGVEIREDRVVDFKNRFWDPGFQWRIENNTLWRN
jgi:methylated-DNA-protein-cysteine methyltransferase-like protein